MRMQTIFFIVLAVAIVGYLVMNREGLRWDRGFAGFRPAVTGVITEGNLEITGNPVDDVAVKAMMIKKILDATTEEIFRTKGLKMFPIETVFIQVFDSPDKIKELKQKRPDVYDAYVKFLQARDKDAVLTRNGDGTDQEQLARAALISYLEQLKRDQDYATVPDNVPATYRCRFLLLETERFYGTEVDVIAIGDEDGIKIQGITSQPLKNGDKIKAFQNQLQVGEWLPYDTIANANVPNKSALALAEKAIKDKWGEDFQTYESTAVADVGQFNPPVTPYLR
ncbi:MAG: hypothetical protein ACO3RQ_09435 [Litorivicinaceae bacterium]